MKRLQKTLDSAARVYRMWHKKHAEEVIEAEYPLDEVDVFYAGIGDSILYSSDKWEEDGDFWDYIHEFDSGPSVFLAEGDDAPVDPRNLMRNDLDGELALPVLAFVKELIFVRDDGSKRSLRFRSPPIMSCSEDKKALVILTDNIGPIYVRGGKMHITERGIHH